MTQESQNIEWKESWRDDHLRWVCGFANGQGGVLIIGRNDRGEAVGVAGASKLLEDLPNKIRDLLGIVVDINLIVEKDMQVLEIHVPAYGNPISYRGRYYLRSGSTLQELKGAALDRFLLRRYGRTWDSVPLPGVDAADLSASCIRKFRETASTRNRLNAADLAVSDSGLIEKLKLTEGHFLKRAAVLLFHEDPDRFITGAFVKIGFFISESELSYHDEIHGSLFFQAHTVVELLCTKYMKAAISYQGLQRIERFPVPYDALREAVLNALIHRDYAVPAPIQIRVYEDKLRIWNPVVMPEGWSLETLLTVHSSKPYNPDVANAFFRSGEIELWGRGIERIFDACRDEDSLPPAIQLKGHDLWVEFPFAPQYLAKIKGEFSEGKNQIQETTQETTQEKIILLLKEKPSITRRELAQELPLSEDGIKYHLNKLKEHKRIQHVGPTKGGYWKVLE
jgi:ATP-dependent DNA helicase RecG